MMEQTLFSDKDVAKILGCGVSTVWRLSNQGKFPKPIKIGGMTRWRKQDIDELLNQ